MDVTDVGKKEEDRCEEGTSTNEYNLCVMERARQPVRENSPRWITRDRKHPCTAINPNLQKLASTENTAVQLPNVLLAAT